MTPFVRSPVVKVWSSRMNIFAVMDFPISRPFAYWLEPFCFMVAFNWLEQLTRHLHLTVIITISFTHTIYLIHLYKIRTIWT